MKKRHKAGSVLLIAMTLFASFEAFAANTFTAVSGSDWNDAVVTATHDDYAGTLSVLKGADIRAGCPPANPGTALFLTVPPPPATIFIVR